MMHGPEMFAPVFTIVAAVVVMLAFLAVTALILLAWCRIFRSAGYHWALGLLMLVPFANLIIPLYLAFAEWPIHRQLKALQGNPQSPPVNIM
ncbi:MAG: hypothetical protein IH624_08555 [Phycisphaerae bacterium]|nr:hypothetical protein [Phycisphaerae bacterium]